MSYKNFNNKEKRHIKIFERRMKYLKTKPDQNKFDKEELKAFEWLMDLLKEVDESS